jgi:hypothetical protein
MIQLPQSYYIKLLTSEYANQSDLQAFLAVIIQPFLDIMALEAQLDSFFDVDTAIGAQLDIIGSIVGANRVLPFQPSNNLSPTLIDDDYRILIKATIGKNFWKGELDSLIPLWQFLFPSGSIIVTDEQDMTMSVFLSGAFSSIVVDMILHDMIIPRPETVLINYYLGVYPLFGFDLDNNYIAGFDKGHWWSVMTV